MKNEDVRLNAAIGELRSMEPDPKEMESAAKRLWPLGSVCDARFGCEVGVRHN